MSGENSSFAQRWSKRKIDAGKRVESDKPDQIASLEAESQSLDVDGRDGADDRELTEDDFLDVEFESLDKSSDYTRFLKANVPEAIQKRALRKLWASDSVFGILDGMNDYDEDFTIDGLAGKAFKSAYKIGRGYLSDEEMEEKSTAKNDENEIEISPDDETLDDSEITENIENDENDENAMVDDDKPVEIS